MKNPRTAHRMDSRTLALALVSAVLVGLVVLPACETVKGAGKDLQNASTNTERAITGDKSAK